MTNDITQADVDAAVDWYAPRRGRRSLLAESFAAHRQAAERAERDRIVAWLRKQSATALAHDLAVFDTYAERKALEMMADLQEREADAIEAGEHLK